MGKDGPIIMKLILKCVILMGKMGLEMMLSMGKTLTSINKIFLKIPSKFNKMQENGGKRANKSDKKAIKCQKRALTKDFFVNF